MAYLSRSITSTNTSYTFSTWSKNPIYGSNQYMFSWGTAASNRIGLYWESGNKFISTYQESGAVSNSSTSKYRDPSAWYHVVLKNDAGTATVYINGEAVPNLESFSVGALTASTMYVGSGFTLDYKGVFAHTHFCDGTAYNPSSFAETDATS